MLLYCPSCHHVPQFPQAAPWGEQQPQHVISPSCPTASPLGEADTGGTGWHSWDQSQPQSLEWAWLPAILVVPGPQLGDLGAGQEQSQWVWGPPPCLPPHVGPAQTRAAGGAVASPKEWQAGRQRRGRQLLPALLLITGSGPQPLRCPSSSRRWAALWHHGGGSPGGSACCSQPGLPSPKPRSVVVGAVGGRQGFGRETGGQRAPLA